MGTPETERLILAHDKQRFVEIFHGLWDMKTSSNDLRDSAHALTLVSAFRDPVLSGDSAVDRFRAILALTGGNGGFPARHFNETVKALFLQSGPREPESGDRGFRLELRDSVQYHLEGDTRPAMFPESSNQIGHFLTAAHIGFYIKLQDDHYEQHARMRAQMEAELHPIVNTMMRIEQLGDVPIPLDEVEEAGWKAIRQGMLRAMIGHELVSDHYRATTNKKADGWVAKVVGAWRAQSSDTTNFLNDRLDMIQIDDRKENVGNSYQDLLLTWVGYRFGTLIASGRFSSRNEAAAWLELMLTNKDLSAVQPTHPFYKDAQLMQFMLEQFRDIQTKKKVESPESR